MKTAQTPGLVIPYPEQTSAKSFNPFQLLAGSQPATVPVQTSSVSATVIQAKWSDLLLRYNTMKTEKQDGAFKTGKFKIGWNKKSLQKWISAFLAGLAENKPKEALHALEGLLDQLNADSKSKIGKPKNAGNNWDEQAAKNNAAGFYTRWKNAVTEHRQYIMEESEWMEDFQIAYGVRQPQPPQDITRDDYLIYVKTINKQGKVEMSMLEKLWDMADEALRTRIKSVISTNKKLTPLSDIVYFLEAVHPDNVGYEQGVEQFRGWGNLAVNMDTFNRSYTNYLAKKKEDEIEMPGESVPHYNEQDREQYRLQPTGKQIKKANDTPLAGDNIYVLSAGDVFYGGAGNVPRIHHSSFLSGQPVKCAGHMRTDNGGNLETIDNTSGHYAPDKAALKRAVVALKEQMNTEDVRVQGYGNNGPQTVDQFLYLS